MWRIINILVTIFVVVGIAGGWMYLILFLIDPFKRR